MICLTVSVQYLLNIENPSSVRMSGYCRIDSSRFHLPVSSNPPSSTSTFLKTGAKPKSTPESTPGMDDSYQFSINDIL